MTDKKKTEKEIWTPEHEAYFQECAEKGWAYDPTNARATVQGRPQALPDGNRQVKPQ